MFCGYTVLKESVKIFSQHKYSTKYYKSYDKYLSVTNKSNIYDYKTNDN